MQGKRHHYREGHKRPSSYAKVRNAPFDVVENEILPLYRDGLTIADISDQTMIQSGAITRVLRQRIEGNVSMYRKSVNPVYVEAIEVFVNNPDLGVSAGYEFGISQPLMGKIIERYFGFRRGEETEVVSIMSKI